MAHAKDLKYVRQAAAVKFDIVYYKPARICLQPWPAGCIKKYWCELHRESSYHPRQLVLIEMSKNTREGAETIPLENVFKITAMEGLTKGKSIFHIMTPNGKFILGTDSVEKTEEWIRTLNEELFGPPKHNVVYEYRVKVQKTHNGDVSYGDYLLKVYDKEIKLYTPNGLIPTKFKCSIKDIHKVKYHAFGQLKSCMTISIKNAQTNHKEVDILILNANSASDMEKVISYRKRKLLSQDELDAETVSHGPHVPAEQLQGCLDELKQKLKAVNVTSRPTKAVDTASEQQKKAHHDALTKEKVFNSDADGASDKSDASNETKALSQNPRSLPLIYRVMSNPSVDDQDGEVWSESFDLRAPKRKQVVKLKKSLPTLPRKTISDRPPAALPEDTETPFEDDPIYVPVDAYTNTLPALGSRQSSVEYECVKPRSSTIPRLKDANTVLTQAAESHSDDYDRDYVISSITASCQQTYIHVLSPEEEGVFAFMPDNIRNKFK